MILPNIFLWKQFKGLAEKLYTEQYPHHLNQARRNEAESDRARLLWAETPSPPPSPPAPAKSSKCLNSQTPLTRTLRGS